MNVAELIAELEAAMSVNPDVAGYTIVYLANHNDWESTQADNADVNHHTKEVSISS